MLPNSINLRSTQVLEEWGRHTRTRECDPIQDVSWVQVRGTYQNVLCTIDTALVAPGSSSADQWAEFLG